MVQVNESSLIRRGQNWYLRLVQSPSAQSWESSKVSTGFGAERSVSEVLESVAFLVKNV